MDAVAESGRNPESKYEAGVWSMSGQAAGRDGPNEPSRETKFLGGNGDREKIMPPVQLTTSRIGNLTWLINNTLLKVLKIHTYCPATVVVSRRNY